MGQRIARFLQALRLRHLVGMALRSWIAHSENCVQLEGKPSPIMVFRGPGPGPRDRPTSRSVQDLRAVTFRSRTIRGDKMVHPLVAQAFTKDALQRNAVEAPILGKVYIESPSTCTKRRNKRWTLSLNDRSRHRDW